MLLNDLVLRLYFKSQSQSLYGKMISMLIFGSISSPHYIVHRSNVRLPIIMVVQVSWRVTYCFSRLYSGKSYITLKYNKKISSTESKIFEIEYFMTLTDGDLSDAWMTIIDLWP